MIAGTAALLRARRVLGACAAAAAICAGGGCASHRPAAMPAAPAPPAVLTIESKDSRLSDALAALRAHPTAAAHRTVAEEYRRVGILDKAYDHLTEALRQTPHDGSLFDLRARVWRDWGLPQFALGDASRAVYFAPASPEAENTLGTVLFALGDLDEAAASFRAALAIDPKAAYALSNLCYVSFTQGDLAQAASQCGDAVKLAPEFTAARNNLGLVYAASEQMDRAEQEFQAAGGASNRHYNMGIVYLARRDYARAADAFDAALREQPSLTEAGVRAQQARALLAQPAGK